MRGSLVGFLVCKYPSCSLLWWGLPKRNIPLEPPSPHFRARNNSVITTGHPRAQPCHCCRLEHQPQNKKGCPWKHLPSILFAIASFYFVPLPVFPRSLLPTIQKPRRMVEEPALPLPKPARRRMLFVFTFCASQQFTACYPVLFFACAT